MARRGDGIYQRGKTWWLDFTHRGERHVARLGKNISRTVAGELARVERAAVLKGEAGIGGPKRQDLSIEKAAELFLAWAVPGAERQEPVASAVRSRGRAGLRRRDVSSRGPLSRLCSDPGWRRPPPDAPEKLPVERAEFW